MNRNFKYLLTMKEIFQFAIFTILGNLFSFHEKNKTLCLRAYEVNSNSQKLPLFFHYIIDEYSMNQICM